MSDGQPKRILKLIIQKGSDEIEIEVQKDSTLIDVVRKIGLPLDGILVFEKGRPVPLDSIASELTELTVINVSSGG